MARWGGSATRDTCTTVHGEDRELALIALVTPVFSRHHFAGDAVRPCLDDVGSLLASAHTLPLGVIAILVLGGGACARRRYRQYP
jgi:hypothetical protein